MNLRSLVRDRYRKELKPMTVCIAAICDVVQQEGNIYPKIIYCIDKQITVENPPVAFEHGKPKMEMLTNSHYALVSSNDSLLSVMILESVKKSIRDKQVETKELVDLIKEKCIEFKNKKIEEDILIPLGLNHKSFIDNSSKLPQQIVQSIIFSMQNYNYNFRTEIIIFGMDGVIPHLYRIDENGNYTCYDFLGFVTVGNGYIHAFSEMTKYPYYTYVTMSEAILRVFISKRVSERASGVGKGTDFGLLTLGKNEKGELIPQMFDLNSFPNLMDLLNKTYENLQAGYTKVLNEATGEIFNIFEEERKKSIKEPKKDGNNSISSVSE